MLIRAFAALTSDQIAQAAGILRAAIAGPSYQATGEAAQETASFRGNDPDRFAIAALDDERVLG